jgi:hypothetical protein
MIEDTPDYMNHPKVKRARALLREAAAETRERVHRAVAGVVCGCGHRRGIHGPAHSVNYGGGLCLTRRCTCINFLPKQTGR